MDAHRIGRLTSRKAKLEDDIAAETRRPAPDSLRLQALKRARLAAKDRLAAFRRGVAERMPRSDGGTGGLTA